MAREVEAIRATYSRILEGRRVALAVSSGASIYRSIDLARLLIRHGADVQVYMTPGAARLVSPQLFHWATGRRPVVRLTGAVEHLACAEAAVVVAAPATASLIAKAAYGIADGAAAACIHAALGASVPTVFVPAMNEAMWRNPALREALSRLESMGAVVVPPVLEEGKAKYPPPEEVADAAIDATAPRDYAGVKVLVTAGPTREHLDDVKYITTPSSGLTGVHFAREARARGAQVTLVAGPGVRPPPGVEVVKVTSVLEMHQAVMDRADHHLYIFAAAPLDFYVERREAGKIPSELASYQVTLRQAPKTAAEIRRGNPNAVVVGFKAEHGVTEEELVRRARRRLEEGGWAMALAHDVSRMGFGTPHDYYLVVTADGVERVGPAHKRELARWVLTRARPLVKT